MLIFRTHTQTLHHNITSPYFLVSTSQQTKVTKTDFKNGATVNNTESGSKQVIFVYLLDIYEEKFQYLQKMFYYYNSIITNIVIS